MSFITDFRRDGPEGHALPFFAFDEMFAAGRVDCILSPGADASGTAAVERYRREALAARATPIGRTFANGRTVREWNVVCTFAGGPVELPVAAVAEGDVVRVYHSMWPLLGRHVLRPAILEGDPAATPGGIVGTYFAALAAGDAAAVTATFEPEGYFREPSGDAFAHRGADLRATYDRFLSAGGGITLEFATATEDAERTALEYRCTQWGAHALPPQAGIAVYRRGPGGKLRSAHVYDDVTAPNE